MKKKIIKSKLKPVTKKGMHRMPNGEMMSNHKMKHGKMTKAQAMKHEQKESKKQEMAETEQEYEY
jgi:hypothetical protein